MTRLDRVSINVGSAITGTYQSAGSVYPVSYNATTMYVFYINSSSDPAYAKSTDSGVTWTEVVLDTGSAISIAIWYDRWSGIDADLVHIAYIDSATDDIHYRNLNLTNDAVSSEYTAYLGASTASGGTLSITRARGGNLMIAGCIDAGAEYDTVKSTDVGVNWSPCAEVFEGATLDQVILLPGWNADTQDIQCIFWDSSADEISVKRYDNSADSWTETSIATGCVDRDYTITAGAYQMRATVDLANSRNVLVFAQYVGFSTSNGRIFLIDDTTITEGTNFFTNDSVTWGVAISINASNWYVYYTNKSGESYVNGKYYRKSTTDAGTTWSAEEQVGPNIWGYIGAMMVCPINDYNIVFYFGYYTLLANIPYSTPRANYQLGI